MITPAMPQEIRDRLALRVASPHNKGKRIWVEHHADGHWLIHANTPRTADRLMARALAAGHPVFTAAFTTS